MITEFYYKNHRGEVELRTVEPICLDYIPTPHLEYGYGPGWFLHAKDYTVRNGEGRNGEPRSFALANIQMTTFDTNAGTKLGHTAFRILLK